MTDILAGPWAVDPYDNESVIGQDGGIMADCWTAEIAQAMSAVPDMLAALEKWLDWLDKPYSEDGQWDGSAATGLALIAAARAAVAKARGL